MPNPTLSDVHVSRPLTMISIGYVQKETAFVASQVFPAVPVLKQADRYFKYDRADFGRNQMQKRAPSTESAGSGYKIDSSPNYFCENWALHKDVDDNIRANSDDPLNPDRDATWFLTQQALINREVQWATKYFTTGIWTGTTVGGDVGSGGASPAADQVLGWDDAHSTPIEDVRLYNSQIQLKTFMRANKLALGRQVWDKIADHPEITDRIKYGASPNAPAIITKQAVAALMELDAILVMDGVKNSGEEGATFEAGLSNAYIGGKNALLVYAAPAPALQQPSGGYTFNWTGLFGTQGGISQRMKSFRMEHLNSDRLEIEQAYDQKVVCADCGVFFSNVVS